MLSPAIERRRRPALPRLSAVVCVVAAVGWAGSPRPLDTPAYPVALAALLGAAALLPAARLPAEGPLSPMGWALLLFHLHLVVAPLLGAWLGFEQGTLPGLPSGRSLNAAILLGSAAYLAFALGAQLAARTGEKPLPPLHSPRLDAAVAVTFVLLGLMGLWLTFGGPGGYLDYVRRPATHLALQESPATLQTALGTFLRPFLPFGLLLWWSGGLRRPGHHGRYLGPTLALAVALVLATASYNRASVVGPLLAVLAAYSVAVRPLTLRAVGAIGGLLLAAGVAFGAYRTREFNAAVAVEAQVGSSWREANAFVQIYGEGPQLLGFLLEQTRTEPLHLGRTLLGSLASPVPVLGKAFREQSGVTFYNRLIYGEPGVEDQIIPFSGELFLNFHLAGVVGGFLLLGWAIRSLHRRFERARTAFGAAAAFYVASWVAFPIAGSAAVLSQILIYGLWPVYGYYGLTAALARAR